MVLVPLTALYVCTKLPKISQRVSKLLKGHNSHSDMFQGAKFRKNKGGIKIVFSAHCLIMLYIFIKICVNISKGKGVIVMTRFPL